MPFVDRRDKNNWYNTLRTEPQGGIRPECVKNDYSSLFDNNEIEIRNGRNLARIPRIKGRIFTRKPDKKHSKTYVDFIADKWRDPETNETHTTKVIIGTVYPGWEGWMEITDQYHSFFDTKGQLAFDPMEERRKREEAEKKEHDTQNNAAAAQEKADTTIPGTETDSRKKENNTQASGTGTPNDNTRYKTEKTKGTKGDERTVDQIREDLLKKEKLLDEKIQTAVQCQNDFLQAKERYEEMIEIKEIQYEKAVKKHIEHLDNILDKYIDNLKEQAKRRPDTPVSPDQIRAINKLLMEIQEVLANCELEDYFRLAEGPDTDNPEGKTGTTYAEMMLLLSPYTVATGAGRYGGLYYKD